MEELENKLFDAAMKGSTALLQELLKDDPLILERTVANRFSETPLHVAAMLGHTDFVREIVGTNPQLTADLDSRQSSPLHLASARGHVDVVAFLLSANPWTHLSRDRNRLTPLHVAALKGRIEVMKVLLNETPDPAQLTVHRGENILHLCVKHHQVEGLKLLVDKVSDTGLINTQDGDGNTLLHLAVVYKQVETIEFLVAVPALDVNALNLNGMTAVDILIQSRSDLRDAEIQELLNRAGGIGVYNQDMANRAPSSFLDHYISSPTMQRNNWKHQEVWLDKKRSALMIVASLIATMAFQAGVNPPGGVWQEDSVKGNSDSDPHRAGSSIMADKYPNRYNLFSFLNSLSFTSSLTIILLLMSGLPIRLKFFVWILIVITWIAITATALTYAITLTILKPSSGHKSVIYAIGPAITMWFGLMIILLIGHGVRLVKKQRKTLRDRRVDAGLAVVGV